MVIIRELVASRRATLDRQIATGRDALLANTKLGDLVPLMAAMEQDAVCNMPPTCFAAFQGFAHIGLRVCLLSAIDVCLDNCEETS